MTEPLLTARQLQAVIDANGDCIKILDLDARLLSMNTGGQVIMEVDDPQQCQNVVLTTLWEGEARTQLEAALDAARAGQTRTFTGEARTFKGTPKWWSVTVAPLRDEAAQITHLLATSRDITAQVRAEQAQQAAQAQLAQQAQLLEDHAQHLEQRVQQQTQALDERAAALDAFVTFTEAVGSDIDQISLARQAFAAVQANLPDASLAYYELDTTHAVWRALIWSGDVSPDIVAQIQIGIPLHAPDFAPVLQHRVPIFVDGWDAASNDVSEAAAYGAVGLVPILIGGQVCALFTVGKQTTPQWTAREQAIVRAVGRGLTVALDRAAQARQLTQQRDDLNRRAQQLETLLQLTEDQGDVADPLALIGRAQALVLGLLPPGFAAYYEVHGGLWQVRVQTGVAPSPALQAAMDAGFPVGGLPSFDLVARTGEPSFVDTYDTGADVDPDVAQGVAAHATLPLIIGGQVRGLFNVPLFESLAWTPADEAVLIATVQHLGVVLERLEHSAQLTRSNAELQTSNQELEAFTYSISHDLRAPVRHVEGFAALALKEMTRGDAGRAERHLGVVVDAATRMETLLDAVLVLSRAGRTPLTMQAVSLQKIVEQVMRDVTLIDPDHLVTWTVDPLPIVQGDAVTLQQALRFLLENAVKFSPGEARVHVWAEDRGDEWAVLVQDEGVGFDPLYAGKLFVAFQRLHTQQEFAGAGIGLATVKRIVTRHGGHVWTDGQSGQGATFGFTLPKRGPQASVLPA
ncbi:PAS domain-containing sensor histidine kinase [Deinococcus radiotolerans]|uniref:histidine kinase n=1 Tax=Deinococcus radiotolerans TaxID=1309407 RepID=A0ABQ2FPI2_9DEIO|nr:ATP-binding protein [Deinococcus radiotolerans]GGL14145.1 hypothetical protein GCM10010844_36210 [Deinococcus radiotolerans]